MKIFTKSFTDNKALINYCRTNNSEISEGMYFNFTDSKISIKNTITKYFINFPFEFKLEGNEELPKNFLINSEQFLGIISGISEIEYKDDSFFFEKNIFKIRVNNTIVFPSNEIEDNYENSFKMTQKFISLLTKATTVFYADKPEDKYKTAYFDKGYIYSLNNYRGYIVKASDEEINIKLDFHTTLIDLIKCINDKDFTIFYDSNKSSRKIVTESGLTIYTPVNRCIIPDFGTKIFEFVNNDHKTLVNRDKVLSTLSTLKNLFDSKDLEKKVSLSVNEKEMIFELKDTVNPYIKLVMESVENTEKCTKIIDYENLVKVIKLIDGENIELKLSDEIPLLIVKTTLENIFEVSVLSIPRIVAKV